MKSFFVLLSFVGSAAMACPDMQGTWTCTNSDGTISNNVTTQETISGGVVYHIKDNQGNVTDYFADGKERSFSDEGMTGSLVAKCSGPSTVQVHQKVTSNDNSLSGTIDFEYTRQNGDLITGVTRSNLSFMGGAPRLSEVTAECLRK